MARSGRIHRDIGGQSATDAAVARPAARQHGVVARRQLRAVGLRDDAIDHRIAVGRLHPLHRGVFAVGHPLVVARRRMDGRRPCRRARRRPEPPRRRGALGASARRAAPGPTSSRRAASIVRDERAPHRAPPDERPPPRDPGDHAGPHAPRPRRTLNRQQLEAAITEAEIGRLTSPTSLADLVARHPGRRGIATSGRSFGRRPRPHRHPLRPGGRVPRLPRRPRPPTAGNEPPDRAHQRRGPWSTPLGRTTDWSPSSTASVIHTTRRNFEEDRARDRALTAAGWRVVRITWRQLHHDATTLAAQLRTLLGR